MTRKELETGAKAFKKLVNQIEISKRIPATDKIKVFNDLLKILKDDKYATNVDFNIYDEFNYRISWICIWRRTYLGYSFYSRIAVALNSF